MVARLVTYGEFWGFSGPPKGHITTQKTNRDNGAKFGFFYRNIILRYIQGSNYRRICRKEMEEGGGINWRYAAIANSGETHASRITNRPITR